MKMMTRGKSREKEFQDNLKGYIMEIKLLGQLAYPLFVKVHDKFKNVQGEYAIVMEYCEGKLELL